MTAFKDWLNNLTAKSTPIDADELYVRDSSGTPSSKKVTWADLKATVRANVQAAANVFTTSQVFQALTDVTSVVIRRFGSAQASLLVQHQTEANALLSGIDAAGNWVAAKTAGTGLKVDPSAPTFGWRDIIGQIELRGTGANDPTFAVYTGTVMRQYQFSATVLQEVFIVFHIPHDYVPGTDIFLHMHWSNAAATPNTGDVRWGFDYAFAKGFDQAAFPAFTTITVTQASPATRYQHMVAETAAITIAALEVDGLLLVRAYRDAANAGDTCTDAVFGHTADIHYQSSNMATKAKAPNFYT